MSNSRLVKFRQPLWDKHNEFAGWHYWGFIGNRFIEPEFSPALSPKEAREQSQQFTGYEDKDNKEAYHNDIIAFTAPAPWDPSVPIRITGQIIWKDGGWWFSGKESAEWDGYLASIHTFEIIGDIHTYPQITGREGIMAEHTKGEWKISNPGRGIWHIFEKKFGHIAIVTAGSADEECATKANARLIAAAPALLVACEELITFEDELNDEILEGDLGSEKTPAFSETLEQIKAAITKAKEINHGRPPHHGS